MNERRLLGGERQVEVTDDPVDDRGPGNSARKAATLAREKVPDSRGHVRISKEIDDISPDREIPP
jgi:hypothetical protein